MKFPVRHIVNGCLIGLAFAAAASVRAQTIQLLSEFQRFDPYGRILLSDRGPEPREIVSPAVARNAYASFQVLVSAPPLTNYFLYVQANPPDIVRTTLYREEFVWTEKGWIPDLLYELRAPAFGVIPEARTLIPDQSTRAYLLDIWIPPDVPPRRVRLEVLMKVGYWIVAPMELRIASARVPDLTPDENASSLPLRSEPADAMTYKPLLDYLLGAAGTRYRPPRTLRAIIRRNAVQDMALAAEIDRRSGRARISPEMLLFGSAPLLRAWTLNAPFPIPGGAEWYLQLREFLLRSWPP